MKATLEEVKAYFKNAKEVKALNTNTIITLTTYDIRNSYNNSFHEWVNGSEGYSNYVYHLLYSDGKYAEIISYKEETFTVSKSFILDLHANSTSTWKELIEKELPNLFKVEPTELTVAEIEAKLGFQIKIVK